MEQMKMTATKLVGLTKRASDLGHDHGVNVSSWVIDGNTSQETCRRIISGYEDGDPEIMDMCPSPLSGEWSGGPTVYSVLKELGLTFRYKNADELIDVYEEAFSTAYWDTVIQAAKAQL
jgi:hypothetical protein